MYPQQTRRPNGPNSLKSTRRGRISNTYRTLYYIPQQPILRRYHKQEWAYYQSRSHTHARVHTHTRARTHTYARANTHPFTHTLTPTHMPAQQNQKYPRAHNFTSKAILKYHQICMQLKGGPSINSFFAFKCSTQNMLHSSYIHIRYHKLFRVLYKSSIYRNIMHIHVHVCLNISNILIFSGHHPRTSLGINLNLSSK